MELTEFIDNQHGNTLATALKKLQSARASADEARIATAFFSAHGFIRIAPTIADIPSVKLLLGADPVGDFVQWHKPLKDTAAKFETRKLKDRLKQQENSIRYERDRIPFTHDASSSLGRLVKALRAGNMQVKRFEEKFLHAKAYIFTSNDATRNNKPEAIIAGSSNLTIAGLTSNLELNLARYDRPTVERAINWFDDLWDRATDFDLVAFFEEIFTPKTPFEIFIRVLWELYGEEIELDRVADKNLPLTNFQKHGVVRALRLINESGGVIVADEVGLGKTFIAGEILTRYQDRRQQALLVCPASLRDTTWKRFKSDHQLYLEVVSFEELARDKQLRDVNKRPNATSENLIRNIDEYQLLIIDEAHNYRNPNTPTRGEALRTLLYGKRKDVLMLTATPVNNSLFDLYHLLRFFVKQDSYLAKRGILSIKERFDYATSKDPRNLSPDELFPIMDATTVKRTRQFVKKYYANDTILDSDGKAQSIVFPTPNALTVRYNIDSLKPNLFDLIEQYLDPQYPACLRFARYQTEKYLHNNSDPDDKQIATTTGLLRSGLLKRFESSIYAFRMTLKRLIDRHHTTLDALKEGHVITTQFFKEFDDADDDTFKDLLVNSKSTKLARNYKADQLKKDIEDDMAKLQKMCDQLTSIKPTDDPKLKALETELETIAKDAQNEAGSREDEIDKRKVLIFSVFADSVKWIYEFLDQQTTNNPNLRAYKGRVDFITGNGDKAKAANRFAPITVGGANYENATDILICTDVLAEGANLQQARHIINYDLPWNPMRLVQRHGRIDRIGSRHNEVFLRTIFPIDRLDALLKLEDRIVKKIAMASASIGVSSPLEGIESSQQTFAESHEEIEKLLNEDASLYERGGTLTGVQSGEEYRQTLRNIIETDGKQQIVSMPWKAGSGMKRGKEQGMFFFAKVGEQNFLRFVYTDSNWQPLMIKEDLISLPKINQEIGGCLRLIECSEDEPLEFDDTVRNSAYDLWSMARDNIYNYWERLTDPANLQPKIQTLQHRVAEFLRHNAPTDIDQDRLKKALNIVESPWPSREYGYLREEFNQDQPSDIKSRALIKWIIETGLEPYQPPERFPIIKVEDIELLVWMAIKAKN